jgi:hypothetical protein
MHRCKDMRRCSPLLLEARIERGMVIVVLCANMLQSGVLAGPADLLFSVG